MATIWPAVPTDSLYKFIAIFGLVLVGFGLWLPERFVAAETASREARKTRDLGHIRVERKRAEVDSMVEEFKTKSGDLQEKINALQNEGGALKRRREPLANDLQRAERDASDGGAKNVAGKTEGLRMEIRGLEDRIHQTTDAVKRLLEEYKPIRTRQTEVMDELKAETVVLKSDTEAEEQLNEQALWWLILMSGSLVGCRNDRERIQAVVLSRANPAGQDSPKGSGRDQND